MKISHENFEEKYIDFLDGNLSQEEEKGLFNFLYKNPDLSYMTEELQNFELQAEEIEFTAKAKLKKDEKIETRFEYLCVQDIENEITVNEKLELESFLNEKKSRKETFQLFKNTKLQPNLKIYYTEKENLKHKSFSLSRSIFPVISIAASILVILSVFSYLNDSSSEIDNHLAEISKQEIQKNNLVEKQTKVEPKTESYKKLITVAEETEIQTEPKKKVISSNPKRNNLSVIEILKINSKSLKTFENSNSETSIASVFRINPEIAIPVVSEVYAAESTLITENPSKQKDDFITIEKAIDNFLWDKVLEEEKPKKIRFWEIASAGIAGINKITKSNIQLKTQEDQAGNVVAYSLQSESLQFSKKLRN